MIPSTVSRNLAGCAVSRKIPVSQGNNPSDKVAAARIKDTKEMAVSLQKAIQMQPDLKNWAATDISFYPYKGDPVYMQIVK